MDSNNNDEKKQAIVPSYLSKGCKRLPNAGDIYAIKFYQFVKNRTIFAAVSKNFVYIYEIIDTVDSEGRRKPNQFDELKVIELISDEDETETENLYSLAWSYDPQRENSPILAVAGLFYAVGIVRLQNSVKDPTPTKWLKGHGGFINDLKFHPQKPELLVSASEDLSIRIWNVQSSVCVLLFNANDNSSQVSALDFNEEGTKLATGHLDCEICIWDLEGDEIKKKIEKSFSWTEDKPFRTLEICHAKHRSKTVNSSGVDSLIWFGDKIISRSLCSDIVLSRIDLSFQNESLSRMFMFQKSEPAGNDCWFIRMAIDAEKKLLAIGDHSGRISVWNLHQPLSKIEKVSLVHKFWKKEIIRMVDFSSDSRFIIAGTDKGRILMFGRN